MASVGFWLLASLAFGFCWLLASVGFWLLAFGFVGCWLLAFWLWASVGFWLLLAFGFWLLASLAQMQQHPMHLGGRRCALPPNPPPAFLFLRMTPLTATPLPRTVRRNKKHKNKEKNGKTKQNMQRVGFCLLANLEEVSHEMLVL